MSSGKREALKSIVRYLTPPFIRRDKSSREASPAPPNPASKPAPSSNAISGHSIGVVGTGRMTGIHSTLPGPVDAEGTQLLDPQPPLAPMPPKNKAFERAIAQVLQKHVDLSDDDKEAFQSYSDVDVMEELRNVQDGTSRISDSLTRVQKVLECVNRFMGPLATFIQHSPEISSLVVGGLNCILMVCILQPLLFVTTYINKSLLK